MTFRTIVILNKIIPLSRLFIIQKRGTQKYIMFLLFDVAMAASRTTAHEFLGTYTTTTLATYKIRFGLTFTLHMQYQNRAIADRVHYIALNNAQNIIFLVFLI